MGKTKCGSLLASLCFIICSALSALAIPGTAAAITFSQTIPTFDFDVGIDYSALTGRLVTSVNFNTNGSPVNLEDVNPFTGARANINGFSGRQEELKLATARAVSGVGCPQNAPVGTIFTSNGNTNSDAQVVMVSPGGGGGLATATLTGEASSLRGGFYFDYRCVITAARGTPGVNYLVVVSGDENPFANIGGNVWLLPILPGPSFGAPILLKTITKPNPFSSTPPTMAAHLEGVIVVPNDSKYGPWAGQIVTGDEDRRAIGPIVNGPDPKIYAINPSTGVCQSSSNGFASTSCPTTFNISGPIPHPEDFDFIEGDFYGVAFNNNVTNSSVQGRILKAPLSDFPASIEGTARPDILITQEYPQTPGDSTPIPVAQCNDVGVNSGLYHIRWNGSQFVSTQLTRTVFSPTLCQWEHVTFVPVSDITIVKTPDGNSFNVGDQIDFTMVVTSIGPGTASNVVLTDPLPTPGNLTTWAVDSVFFTGLITPTPTTASCSIISGNQLTCNLGSMAPGATVSVKVKTTTAGGANSDACTTNNGRVNNTATVTADGPISKTDTGFWLCQAGSYTLTKNPKNATYNIGDNINFTMVVASTGPGTALNVVLNDPLPTLGNLNHWTLTTNPGGVCTISAANVLNCQFGNLPNGATRTVVVATDAVGGANASACPGGQKLNNTATLTGTGQPTLTDTGDYICTPPGGYTLTKNPKNATYNIGDNINFTMVVTSTGPGTANNVVLNDPLPTLGNLNTWIITSNPGGCTIVSNVLNCQFGNLPNGASRTVMVSTNASGGANITACPGGQKLNNTATLTGTGLPTLTDTGDYICTPPGGYTLTKNPKNATYSIGQNINFTMVVTSTGPGTANNVVLNDPLPTLGNLNSWIITSNPGGCTINGANVLNCQFGNLPSGATRTVLVSTNAPGGADISACPGNVKLNNTATLTGTGLPTLTDTGDYICTPPGGYTLTKNPKNATYSIGQNINFTMVVTSTGPGTANNVVLNDPLPTLGNLNTWTITSNPGGCTINGANVLNCQFGNLANGQTRTVTVSTTAPGGADISACPGNVKLNNTATLTGTGLPTLTDTGDYICQPPQLRVVKTPDNGTFTQGSQVSFTIVVSNPAPVGASPATNVQLTDVLPGNGGLVWQTATPTQGSCVNPIAGNFLSCSLGTIAAGGAVTVTVLSTPTTPPGACQSQPNPVALATANGGLSAQDSGSLNCTPPPPQLTVVKTPDNGTFNFLGQASFTIVVSNPAPLGAQAASNVQLTDQLPGNGGLVWQTATPTQGSCVNPIGGNFLSCSLGTIAAGSSVTVTVLSTATTPAAACQQQPNPVALATANGGLSAQDSGSLNCTPPPAQLTVVKHPKQGEPASTFTGGSQVFFTIVVSNPAAVGSQAATNVQLSDLLPSAGGLTFVTAIATQGTCVNPIVGNSLSCNLGTIPAGGSVTVTVLSTATTPLAACQEQPNPLALATANGGLSAQDTGFLTCQPPPGCVNGNCDMEVSGASLVGTDAKHSFHLFCHGDPGEGLQINMPQIVNPFTGQTVLDVKFKTDLGLPGVITQNTCFLDPGVIADDPSAVFNRIVGFTLGTLDKGVPGVYRADYAFRDGGKDFGLPNSDAGCYVVRQLVNGQPGPVIFTSPAGTNTNPPDCSQLSSLTLLDQGNQKAKGGGTTPTGPVITGISPSAGPLGTTVTITGSGFGATQGTSTITFNGVTAIPTSFGPNSIVVPIPAGAATGPVVVTVNGLASNAMIFVLTPQAPQTSTLTVASSNPGSGVSIGVSPSDNNGQGTGSTQFTRTFNTNSSVTLTAPSTAGGNTFSSWTGCDATSATVCVVNLSTNRTVTANYATSGGGTPSITLSFDGQLRDRVGQGEFAVAPDGQLDGTFTVTLSSGSGNRTVTGMTLTRTGPIGVWDTTPGDQFWVLGAASGLDTALLNASNGTVNFPLTAGGSFKIFAADFVNASFPNGLFTPGSTFTLTVNFSDGSTATQSVTIGGGGSQTSVLTVATSNPSSGVSISVSPSDINGQGAGSSQFTRTFNNNTSVILTAPATAGGNTFTSWSGCDATSGNVCTLIINANRTVTANYAISSGGPSISLGFDGQVRDKVGQGELALGPDGQLDGTFTVTLSASSGNRTVTGLTLTRTGPVGVWDTILGDQFWVLGAANTLDSGLLNTSTGAVSFPVVAGSSFKIFAADFVSPSAGFPNGLFIPGSNFTLAVSFADGSTATGNAVIGGSQSFTLTVASSNPGSGVNVSVTPNDNNGQGTGSSQFTRTFNSNTSVTLTAPATAGGNTFTGWSGCDATSGTLCTLLINANRTVTANYAISSGSPSISLGFDGQVRDRVGQGELALGPDGQLDGTFTVTLSASSGNRTVTGLTLTRAGPIGIWDTVSSDGFWVLGAAMGLDTALLNASNGTVNFPLTAGSSFKSFAANFVSASAGFPGGLFIPGSTFTLTVNFSDGSTATASTTL